MGLLGLYSCREDEQKNRAQAPVEEREEREERVEATGLAAAGPETERLGEPDSAGELVRHINREYVRTRLGAASDDPWFEDVPQEEGYLYFIAVSGKAASEQLARTRAREEAQRLVREYSKAGSGEEPGPAVGRGIEPVGWRILSGVTPEGQRYYIACLLTRFK
jgi:hypothetical protein